MRAPDEARRPAAGDAPAIEGLDAAVYVIPTDAPEADGTLAWDKTTMVVVTARAGGQHGIGWTYAAGAAAAVVTDVLAGVVAGRSALDVPAAAEAMARSLRNIGRAGVAAMALSAADIALWDLKARLLGLPLADLLGRAQPAVPIYGSGGFTSYDEQQTRAQLADWVEPRGSTAGRWPTPRGSSRPGRWTACSST
jgi:L-alanine-DL-glutamate epimerase-like enolase superfamily enzyme